MPIIKKQTFPNGTQLGIWRIAEEAEYFLNIMDITESSLEKIAKMNNRRKTEWLAARYLLQELLGKNVFCYSDEFGKPIIKNSDKHLSISHSKGLVTVMVSDFSIGIDIQEMTSKIQRIAYKFMRNEESESLNLDNLSEHLHIFWGAKEALYKAYGKKELDFKAHIFVEPFAYLPKGETIGKVKKEGFEEHFNIFFEKIENYYLVFAEESELKTLT
jgi:4'-phosphopantetheinyl transferase EntD